MSFRKQLVNVLWLFALALIAFRLLNMTNHKNDNYVVDIQTPDQFFGTGENMSWLVSSWENISWSLTTWNIVEVPPSEIEIFSALKDKKTVYFTVQPLEYNWDFSNRTQILVAHAKSNMQTINIPPKIKWWYLYIKLRDNLPSGRSAVIYIKAWSRYCWGWIKQMWYTYNNNEYLYKLTYVPLIWSNCWDNRLSKIAGQTISIWWYVWTFDWNWIQQITISRY